MIKNKLGWVFFAFIFALGVGAGGLGGVALADCPAVTISEKLALNIASPDASVITSVEPIN